MNPAALAMIPMITSNPTSQSNTTAPNSTSKFGEVLDHAMSNNVVVSEPESTKTDLTAEQKKVIGDVLDFLGLDRLSDVKDGNKLVEKLLMDGKFSGGNDVLLQILMKLTGQDGSAVAEFLASLGNLSASASKEDKLNKVDSILSGVLTELSTRLKELTSTQTQTQTQTEDLDNKLTDIPSEIYTLLQKLDSLDVKDWSKQDLNATASILKVAKLQDLLSSQKDMTAAETQMQKEIKNLLDSISSKLEKWLGSQPTKSSNEAISAVLLESSTNKSLDAVKQVFARMLNTDDETSNETVSKGLTLKTAETNSQSSGLPFQMTKLEQFVLTASKNGQVVDANQFVKSFENILNKANFSNANGVQKLLIRLNPENLGSLRIELVQKDGAMIAKILATTAQAKELLDRQVQGLKQAFTNQNIQVEKIDISQQVSTFNAERFAGRDGGQQEQRQQKTKKELIEEEETDFTNSFEEALLNLKV